MKTAQQQSSTKARRERRRAAGMCADCNTPTAINPHTGKPRLRCQHHNARSIAASVRYQAALRDRWLAIGGCVQCGRPCSVNRVTGAPYRRCLKHRLMSVRRVRAYAKRQAQMVVAA